MTTISNIDFHCHTKASDGGLTPTEVVQRAFSRGLNYLAITDHDLVAGVAEAMAAAQKGNKLLCSGAADAPEENYILPTALVTGVKNGTLERDPAERQLNIIPGIEFSTTWRNEQIHIVGLYLDIENAELTRLIDVRRGQRVARAVAIGERLERLGFERPYERCCEQAQPGASITRGNYARLIFQDGKARSIDEAFNKYLRRGQKAYVRNDWGPVDETVAAIKAAGGIAVLAHPRRYKISNRRLRMLIEDFIACGGEAIEVSSSQQSEADREYLTTLCRNYKIMASLGSDFHNPDIFRNLGQNLDLAEDLTPVWHAPQARAFAMGEQIRQRVVSLTFNPDADPQPQTENAGSAAQPAQQV